MKALFYAGVAGFVLFSFLKYNAVMPVPLADFESLAAAFLLHDYRWFFRIFFLLLIAAGSVRAFRVRRKWVPVAALSAAVAAAWFFNFHVSADAVFEQPETLTFKSRGENRVDGRRLVVGVEHNGEAKAYPIRFLVFHHQVRDTIGGKPVIVTYCNTCKTARVYEPVVQGHQTTFRIVGLNHFNSVYEDAATGSWWQQATGKAVAGPSKGQTLPELKTVQLTVQKWFELRPDGLVMQSDPESEDHYPSARQLERASSKGRFSSWKEESWVIGVELHGVSKAYDWNRLRERRIINDQIAGRPIMLALAADQQSIAAFERPLAAEKFSLHGDLLSAGGRSYDFAGRDLASPRRLAGVKASQEYWRCRRYFYPDTQQ